jgi:hypothetical protein
MSQHKCAKPDKIVPGITQNRGGEVYDYLCSIGELFDKLSIQNIICHYANTKILEERAKAEPDDHVISQMELKARTAGEQRVRLKDEINRRLDDAIRRGGIGVAPEVRTYNLPGSKNA